jgi:hypothetical protein
MMAKYDLMLLERQDNINTIFEPPGRCEMKSVGGNMILLDVRYDPDIYQLFPI